MQLIKKVSNPPALFYLFLSVLSDHESLCTQLLSQDANFINFTCNELEKNGVVQLISSNDVRF